MLVPTSLKAKYKTERLQGALHFEYVLLDLSPDDRKLSGRFLSFGSVSQKIGWGIIEFDKTT
jgi:hypothetical protein